MTTPTSTTVGYGQMTPNDMFGEFNRISFIVRQMMARMDTMKLVQVVAVHGGGDTPGAATGTVDVTPLVNQIDGLGNPTPHGTISGVPWFRLQGGANAVICDPAVGDVGYVVASDRDIGLIQNQTPGSIKQANPGSFRRFDIADGIYVGSVFAITPTQYVIFRSDGIRVVDKNGNSVVMASAGITATDSNGNVIQTSSSGITLTGNTKVNGTLEVTGTVTADGNINAVNVTASGQVAAGSPAVHLTTHTHTGVTTGAGTSGPPTPGS